MILHKSTFWKCSDTDLESGTSSKWKLWVQYPSSKSIRSQKTCGFPMDDEPRNMGHGINRWWMNKWYRSVITWCQQGIPSSTTTRVPPARGHPTTTRALQPHLVATMVSLQGVGTSAAACLACSQQTRACGTPGTELRKWRRNARNHW